jgi:hypothetical protein
MGMDRGGGGAFINHYKKEIAMSALTKIVAHAKKLYKRGGSWKAAIKKSGVAYRAGKLGRVKGAVPKRRKKLAGTKKRAGGSRRKTVKRVKSLHAAEGRAIKSLGSVSSHISMAKKQLKEQIGWAEADRFAATTKTAKRKKGRHIAELKSKYRKLC